MLEKRETGFHEVYESEAEEPSAPCAKALTNMYLVLEQLTTEEKTARKKMIP